jgi:hypothetical protein
MSSKSTKSKQQSPQQPLIEHYASQPQVGIVREFTAFLAHNKKWWLTPIIIMLLLLGVLVFLGGTGAAPWIYSLF